MMRLLPVRWAGIAVIALILGALLLPALAVAPVFAQDAPVAPSADTPTPEPATSTPTSTPTSTATSTPTVTPTASPVTLTPSATPVFTETPAEPTSTPTPRPTPSPRPVPIPEPVTVVLFGTGLAALSAAIATRRGKN